MEEGCKSKTGKVLFDFEPHSHISYMKALSGRQTCLVALRYDDAAVDVSADMVTHTHCPIWKTDLREQRYTHTQINTLCDTHLLQLEHLLQAKMWKPV